MRPKVCISYSSKDADYCAEFVKILKGLENAKKIESWTDNKLVVGQEWNKTIQKEFGSSDIFIFLVSPDFLSSDYIHRFETVIAAKREEQGAVIIPIFLKPCNFEAHEFLVGRFHAAPKGRWVSDFVDENKRLKLYREISKNIQQAVELFISDSESNNWVFFGATLNMRHNRERKRICAVLRKNEEKEEFTYHIGPTSEEIEEMADLEIHKFRETVKDHLDKASFFIMFVDASDEFSRPMFEELKAYNKRTEGSGVKRAFFYYIGNDFECVFRQEVELYTSDKDNFVFEDFNNSVSLAKNIFSDISDVFLEEQRNKMINTPVDPDEVKNITLFYTEEDADNLMIGSDDLTELLFENGLEVDMSFGVDKEEILEIMKSQSGQSAPTEQTSITALMLQQSSGFVLFYSNASHNWYRSVQMFLKKYTRYERDIEPRIVFVDEPGIDKKERSFVSRSLFRKSKFPEVSRLTQPEQALEDLEVFINRVKKWHG